MTDPLARTFPRSWGWLVRNRILVYTIVLIGLSGIIMNRLFGGNLVQTLVTGLVIGSIYVLGATGLSLLYGIKKFANFAHGDLMTLGAYMAFFVNVGPVAGLRPADVILVGVLTFLLAGLVLLILLFRLTDIFKGRVAKALELVHPILVVTVLLLAVYVAKAVFGPGHLAIGLVYAVVVLAFVGIILETLIFRKLEGKGLVAPLIASVGVAIVIQNVINAGFGTDIQNLLFPRPPNIETPWFQIPPVKGVLTLVVSVSAVLFLHFMLSRTTLGKSMRATSDNVDLARSSGINTSHVTLWTWVISCMLAGLGGVLLAMSVDVRPLLGFQVLLFLFAAVIIGGIGSPYGAMIGGFAVGVIQELSSLLLDWLDRPQIVDYPALGQGLALFSVLAVLVGLAASAFILSDPKRRAARPRRSAIDVLRAMRRAALPLALAVVFASMGGVLISLFFSAGAGDVPSFQWSLGLLAALSTAGLVFTFLSSMSPTGTRLRLTFRVLIVLQSILLLWTLVTLALLSTATEVVKLEAAAAYRPMAAFIVMIIVLLIRPEGLLGTATRKAARGATLRARLFERS